MRALVVGIVAGALLVPGTAAAELFRPAATYENGHEGVGLSPEGVATADLDGDGDRDLAVGDIAGGAVRVLLGRGDGTFAQPAIHPTGEGASTFGFQSVEAADFDRDGLIDLAVISTQPGRVTVLRNVGDGRFAPAGSYPAGSGPTTVAIGDVDGDRSPDMAVADGLGLAATILRNDGSGRFTTAQGPAAGPTTVTIRTADVSGDGRLDLLMGHWPLGVSVLLGAGDGTFAAKGMLSAPPGLENFDVADVNRDGRRDLVVGNVTTNQVSTHLGHGDGTFAAPVRSTVNPGSSFPPTTPNAVAVGEFTGDGIPDVAVSGDFDDTIYVMAGDATGAFSNIESHRAPGNPRTVAADDLDGDGQQDLVIGTNSPGVLVFLHGAGSPSRAAEAPRIRLTVQPRRVAAFERLRLRFRVRSAVPECRRGVRIEVAGRHVRSDSRGRASLRLRPGRSSLRKGRLRAVARKAGCRAGAAIVRVVRP